MDKNTIDYSLYLVTDRTLMSTPTLEEAVEDALKGGCTLVQLREKKASSKDFFAMAQKLRALTHAYNVPLIINDRVDIALAADADGVHIGQQDLPAATVRSLLGPDKIMGVSVHTLEEACAAQDAQADYVGVGAMFTTSTKPEAVPVSLAELNRIRRHLSIPLVVIGGITSQSIPQLSTSGIDGFAIVSAILAQPNIEQATHHIRNIILTEKMHNSIGSQVRISNLGSGSSYTAPLPMQACIFDLDGTLLDSLKVWQQIDIEFLHKRGHTVPPDYIEGIASLGLREAAGYTIKRFGLAEDADSLIAEWKALASHAYRHTIPLKPYAKEYLCTLKARGIKLAVATSLPASLYTPALQRHGLLPLFDALCSVDEVCRGKNHPDIYILAAQRLGIDPRLCQEEDMARIYVFEDIPQAIRSARHLGMTVYGVYDESSAEHWETIVEIADGVIADFRDAPHYSQP